MEQLEKEMIESVNKKEFENVRSLLADGVTVDCLDQNGMTPLQHAAYKGDLEMCQLLVKHGANVNANFHNHGYTALMFAALSGNKQVVRFLLENGASTTVENSVNRTASQMAGFVGRHEIVTLINNFFSKEEIDFYCMPRGSENEPKLPPSLSTPLYRFCVTVNLNPVRLAFVLREMPDLLRSSKKVIKVLDLLCEKMMKKKETDEVMALRFHYISVVLEEAAKFNNEKQDNLESWIKHLIKCRLSDGFPVNQEILVRESLRTFPYPEAQLFQHAVRSIASKKLTEKLTAISVLTTSINGQRFPSEDDKQCGTCGEYNGKTCNTCKSVYYCNKECQMLHWPTHKKFCKELSIQHEKLMKLKEMEKEGNEKSREKEDSSVDDQEMGKMAENIEELKLDQLEIKPNKSPEVDSSTTFETSQSKAEQERSTACS